MASHNLVQAQLQCRHLEWTSEAESGGNVVHRTPRFRSRNHNRCCAKDTGKMKTSFSMTLFSFHCFRTDIVRCYWNVS